MFNLRSLPVYKKKKKKKKKKKNKNNKFNNIITYINSINANASEFVAMLQTSTVVCLFVCLI